MSRDRIYISQVERTLREFVEARDEIEGRSAEPSTVIDWLRAKSRYAAASESLAMRVADLFVEDAEHDSEIDADVPVPFVLTEEVDR
jgi:hypothetical protein